MEETRFRSFGQIITNLFKEGQKGILWLYLVFIPGAFVLLLMINSSASQLQKSTFGLVYLQKREISGMNIITMMELPSNFIYMNLQQTWSKNVLVQNILYEMRISEEFIKDRNEKSIENLF